MNTIVKWGKYSMGGKNRLHFGNGEGLIRNEYNKHITLTLDGVKMQDQKSVYNIF